MQRHAFLPHIGDVKLQVEGDNQENLFQTALRGMNEFLRKKACQNKEDFTLKKSISIVSSDQTSLLIDFLSEVLALSEIHKAIFCQVDFSELKENKLKAKLLGRYVSSFDQAIKAVTYHQAAIKRTKDGRLTTEIVFDI